MKPTHELYMQRCIDLALLGQGRVAPNPMVGSVLVYDNRIIGEGYHQQFGGPHAEVNCIASVKETDRKYIPEACLYVSLEPCSHVGKTPPCTNLIIEQGIKMVVIGCKDSFEEVNGKGIEKLKKTGIKVITGVLEQACKDLNRRFFTFHKEKRPYIILKWAETADGRMAGEGKERLLISNKYTNRLVHKWRMEEPCILTGTNTALVDDPSLDNRLWTGASPVRMVLDLSLRLPRKLKLFNQEQRTIVFNLLKNQKEGNIQHFKLSRTAGVIIQINCACLLLDLQSLLVEGGAKMLRSFIEEGVWDEARVITNTVLETGKGLKAPILNNHVLVKTEKINTDIIRYYQHQAPEKKAETFFRFTGKPVQV